MKISRREIVLGVTTLAAVLAASVWYTVSRNLDVWRSRKDEIAQIKRQISFNQQAIKMQGEWMEELEKLQSQLVSFDSQQRSVAPELLKTVKKIADAHGLDITRTTPQPEKKIGDLYEMAINCTWEGSLDALVHFLVELQQQGSRYDVHTLNASPVGANSNRLKGNMVVYCAFLRTNAATATADEEQ